MTVYIVYDNQDNTIDTVWLTESLAKQRAKDCGKYYSVDPYDTEDDED